jgi:restriction endonuclease S subunit
MKEVELGEIATVTSGFAFRKKIEPDPTGGFFVIQGKDIRSDHTLRTGDLTPIRLPAGSRVSGKLIEAGNILVMCRGEFPYATHVADQLPPTVAQNSFSVLQSLNPNEVIPAYLTLVLNQSAVQRQIRQRIKGTKIPYLSIENLRNLKIPHQPIRHQMEMLALHDSMKHERQLHRTLEKRRRNLLDALLLKNQPPANHE